MKITRLLAYAIMVVVSLALVHSTAKAQTASTASYTNSFDNGGNTSDFSGSGSVASWIYWYSMLGGAITNDITMDADGDTNTSGSLYVSLPFTNTAPNQQTFFGTYDNQYGYDGTEIIPLNVVTQLSFDIHVQPGSPTNTDGNFGTITIALIDPKWAGADFGAFTGITIPGSATNGWVHLVDPNTVSDIVKLEGLSGSPTTAAGVGFDYNSYSGYPKSPITFWIDNVAVTTAAVPPPPPPPPTVSIAPAIPGLNLFTGSGGAPYNREDIQAANNNYSWVGASGPVTYSFTITNYPVGTNDAVQTQLFLVPSPGTESDPDWHEPNVVFLDMENSQTFGGGANMMFRYKTNEPDGNGMIYGVGTLATIGTNTALGTWSVTFANNTNVTMTAPGGATTNFSIPDPDGSTAALFASGVNLYFGAQAGTAGFGIDDHIIVSDFSVSGLGAADFNDNFIADAGALNTGIWFTNAAFPNCVQMIGPGDLYWAQWTSPAVNYTLDMTTDLAGGAWTAVTNEPAFQAGTNYTQLITTNDVNPGTNAFFAVVQPHYQLQVLWPGETAAPGTPTGKTGTPDAISIANGPVTLTVNAVDAKYNPVSTVNDNVSFASSDSAATLPANSPLTGGTGQFSITFATAGSQTVTASDVQNTSIVSGQSAPVTVTP